MLLISRKREPNQTIIRLMKYEETLCLIILIFGLSRVPGCLIIDDLEAFSLVVLESALVEGAIWEPKEAEAILFIFFIAAFVNASISEPKLSDSVFFALVPITGVFGVIRESVGPRAMNPAIIEVSFVKVTFRISIYALLAMRLIFDEQPLIHVSASVIEDPSYLDILFPFSIERYSLQISCV